MIFVVLSILSLNEQDLLIVKNKPIELKVNSDPDAFQAPNWITENEPLALFRISMQSWQKVTETLAAESRNLLYNNSRRCG